MTLNIADLKDGLVQVHLRWNVDQWAAANTAFRKVRDGAIRKALAKAVHAEAHFMAGKIKLKIRNGPFQPLTKLTLAGRKLQDPPKRGSKPLIASSTLFQSITVYPTQLGSLEKFVGVIRRPHGKKDTADLAEIHEEGRTIVIPVTAKMLAFLAVLFKKAGMRPTKPKLAAEGGERPYIIVRIPPRPFLAPTLDENSGGSLERMTATVRKVIPW